MPSAARGPREDALAAVVVFRTVVAPPPIWTWKIGVLRVGHAALAGQSDETARRLLVEGWPEFCGKSGSGIGVVRERQEHVVLAGD